MKEQQYEDIMSFLKDWVKEEGLCRFCDIGRVCPKSRRGRPECPRYTFSNEMDCFHLWIAAFDKKEYYECFRSGYDSPDSYPWKNKGPEADLPPESPFPPEANKETLK